MVIWNRGLWSPPSAGTWGQLGKPGRESGENWERGLRPYRPAPKRGGELEQTRGGWAKLGLDPGLFNLTTARFLRS